jgi:PAS domain S-box-containing protein
MTQPDKITIPHQTYTALVESEAILRTLTEMTGAAIFIFQGPRLRYVNPAAAAVTGYTQTELLAMNFWEVAHPDTQTAVKTDGLARLQGQPAPAWYELKLLTKNGQERWVRAKLSQIEFQGEPAILGSAFDITERKLAEEALQQSEARLLTEIQSVLAITRALVSQLNLETVLEFIITQAEYIMAADGAAVFMLTADGQHLEIATPGETKGRLPTGSRFALANSLAEAALSTQKTQICNRTAGYGQAASICALLPSGECGSVLIAPLIAEDKSLGILLIWSRQEQRFSQDDSRLMGLFADQSALAIHTAHLHKQKRQLAIEQERHRLARDLHDSATQSLHSIGLAAQTAIRRLDPASQSQLREPLDYIRTLAGTTLAEVREQIYHLYPTRLGDMGLVKALARYGEVLSQRYNLSIEFSPDPEPELSPQQREELYYVAREAIWNAVKHADASRIEFSLRSDGDQIVLAVVDNGTGFEPALVGKGDTVGLRNMAERARLLGGTFELASKPGEGARITVRIPH